MKKKLLKNIFSLITFIVILFTVIEVIRLDVLPNKYLLLFGSVLVILNIIASLLLFVKGIISKLFSIFLYLILYCQK